MPFAAAAVDMMPMVQIAAAIAEKVFNTRISGSPLMKLPRAMSAPPQSEMPCEAPSRRVGRMSEALFRIED